MTLFFQVPNLDIMSIVQEKSNYVYYFAGFRCDEQSSAAPSPAPALSSPPALPLPPPGLLQANVRLHRELAKALDHFNVVSIPMISKVVPKVYDEHSCYVRNMFKSVLVSFLDHYDPKKASSKTLFCVRMHATSQSLLADKILHP